MHEVPFVRSAYNYDRDVVSDETGINCQTATVVDPETGEYMEIATPSLAKQSFAEDCDINVIVRRFNVTGQLPTGVRMPTYQDFADVPTYHEAMNAIVEAQEAFMMMPWEVRARFHNDPAEFVDFCSNAENRAEAAKLGLVEAASLAAPAPQAPSGAAAPPAPSPGSPPSPPAGSNPAQSTIVT